MLNLVAESNSNLILVMLWVGEEEGETLAKWLLCSPRHSHSWLPSSSHGAELELPRKLWPHIWLLSAPLWPLSPRVVSHCSPTSRTLHSAWQLATQRQKQQILLKAGLETGPHLLHFLLVKASHEASALEKSGDRLPLDGEAACTSRKRRDHWEPSFATTCLHNIVYQNENLWGQSAR